MIKKFFSLVIVFLYAGFFALESDAQIFRDAPISRNVVDFELTEILTCNPNNVEIPFVICEELLPLILDQLVEAEEFLDQLFVGYRRDMPRFVRNQLQGNPVLIRVRYFNTDGAGGVLATAGPDQQFVFQPPLFLVNFRRYRSWILPQFSTINMDVNDIIPLLMTDELVEVVVHEAIHAMGHPSSFEGPDPLNPHLNRPLNFFDQVNFLGDDTGINGIGFGLNEFRSESANPFAQFIPLSTNDGGGHLSPFEPAFNRPAENLQEAFLPTAPFGDIQAFMSRSLRGMFADLAFEVTGITNEGILDINGDGLDDNPLIINPDN